MALYRKIPKVVEAITFDEFVQYGIEHCENLVNGEPWSFHYKGHPITQEDSARYLIPTLEGTHNFTPEDMLIIGVQGEIYPCKIDIFKETYEYVGGEATMNEQTETTMAGEMSPVRKLFFDAVLAERDRQDQKWGYPQYNSIAEWSTYMLEEAGEAAEALNNMNNGSGEWDKAYAELIQTAAMCLSTIEHIDLAKRVSAAFDAARGHFITADKPAQELTEGKTAEPRVVSVASGTFPRRYA